ncbi:conserved hypothetical protein [Magnetospirillum sp. LM-5]|uniref:sensor histidine kinase n=1 Tax=Magnetospirillum sp. LM-5 TaxID=2681466 RepID=UPI00137DA8D8|nr:ATP-binding protein [Magnetospirillum sp. LM-5]CAA7614412.1 conserved hypothetical protein [Magnetospirillum sp. LM-5]
MININDAWQDIAARVARLACALVVGVGIGLGTSPVSAQTVERLSPQLERHTSIALLIDPATGRIVDANAAAEAFYGYPAATLRTMAIQEINRLGPEEVAVERAKAAREQRDYFIFPHKIADGSIHTVEVYSSPVKGDGGKTLLLSIIHDISGKAVAEEELTAYRTRLEELVEQRTARARVAEERLRFWLIGGLAAQAFLIVLLALAVLARHATVRQLRAEVDRRTSAETRLAKAKADLQRFAEISAHHLREPTRHLMIFSQKLRKRLGSAADEDMELSLSTIEAEAAYLHALVRDVQVYLAADMPLGVPGAVDPAEVARAVVAGMGGVLLESKGTVVIGRLPPLPVDSVRLKYLFGALIDNAVRYRHPDRAPQVMVEGHSDGRQTVLTITDNGVGIPDEYRQRVFEVFEHLGGRQDGQGTGLGLAVARRIVESCEGSIRLEPAEGGGTQVVIEFSGKEHP